MVEPLDDATKARASAWMAEQHWWYFSYTLLASACGDALDLTGEAPDYTVPEELYELARAWYPDC
jgi:hypothetical protein